MDDPDDLFGGLPAVSNADNALATSGPSSAAAADIAKHYLQPKPPAPVDDVTKKTPEKRKAESSLVSTLGTAGTAMAFVPNAIRKKKRIPSKQCEPQPQQSHIANEMLGTPNNNSFNSNNAPSKDGRKVHISEISSANEINTAKDESENHQTNENAHDNNGTGSDPYLENEPESLRLLHASVVHPYDPHFPNDYLAYRERKKTEQVRKDLQRTALQRLDQQEKMRKKIKEERNKILESGDLEKIAENQGAAVAVVRGRGRGRGVTNLPAWLLKKKQEQKELEATVVASNSGPKLVNGGQFDHSNQ